MAAIREALMTAIQHHQAGRRQAAEQIYRDILNVDPNQPDALHLLGVLALEVGQFDLGIEYIRRAIQKNGRVAAFHNNLGEAYRAIGKPVEAEHSFRRALKLNPNYAEAHSNLGNALWEQKKLDEAVASYRKALRLRPDYAEAHNNLGNALHDLGKLDHAIAGYRRALEVKPNYSKAHFNLGAALKDQGSIDLAIACFRRALELKPDFAEAHSNLSNILWERGESAEAVACGRRAVQCKPELAEAHNNLANALRSQGALDEAVQCYQRALQIKPDFTQAQSNLGDALIELGQFGPAEAAFRRAMRLNPAFAPPYSGLAMLLRGDLPEDDFAALESRVSGGAPGQPFYIELVYALAHVLDAQGDYPRAAGYLVQANALRLRQNKQLYDPVGQEAFLRRLMQAFEGQFFARLAGAGLDSQQPVFIVGLPRSGTTLVEQILASHPAVFGAGELDMARLSFDAIPKLTPRPDLEPVECVESLDATGVGRLAERHLDGLRKIDRRGAERIVDKMPENYLFLGLLCAMFPKATFIHCHRDLRDVAVSCWMTDFRGVPWANDIEHIVTRFDQYCRMMEHWRGCLPAPIHHVGYEETVDDLEGVARRLVAACRLEWDPACLEFYRTQRPIRTASVSQVRRPVYRKSLGRWRNYEQPLAELFARLPANFVP